MDCPCNSLTWFLPFLSTLNEGQGDDWPEEQIPKMCANYIYFLQQISVPGSNKGGGELRAELHLIRCYALRDSTKECFIFYHQNALKLQTQGRLPPGPLPLKR